MDGNLIVKRYLVAGRVQGVFFRASTKEQADKLGLRGRAVNLPDGRVEVLAIGEPGAVSELAQWLRQGPRMARVSHVDAQDATGIDVSGVTGFSCG